MESIFLGLMTSSWEQHASYYPVKDFKENTAVILLSSRLCYIAILCRPFLLLKLETKFQFLFYVRYKKYNGFLLLMERYCK